MGSEIFIKVKIEGDIDRSRFYLRSLLDYLKTDNSVLKILDYEFIKDNKTKGE